MGRHSAPDDDESVVAPVDASLAGSTTATLPAVPPVDAPEPRGRHAVVDEAGEAGEGDANGATVAIEAPTAAEVTDVLAPVDAAPTPAIPAPPAEPTGTPAKPAPEKKPAREKKPKRPKEPKPPKPPKPPKSAKQKKPKKDSATRADLRLLRENGAVRARCIAAVLLAFLAYTVVMVVLDKADSYLLWLWVPIVVSGILVGSVLDLAYRAKSREEARAAASKQPTS